MNCGWWFDDEPDKGELWTAYEAAAALGIKPATIRSWVHRGKLTPAEARDRMGRAQFWETDLRAVMSTPSVDH